MTYQEVGQLAIVLRIVNADVYREIFENFVLPNRDEWFADSSDFIFQDDSVSPYREKKNNHFLKRNGNSLIKTMKWSWSSPDLNTIENIRNTLKQTVNN